MFKSIRRIISDYLESDPDQIEHKEFMEKNGRNIKICEAKLKAHSDRLEEAEAEAAARNAKKAKAVCVDLPRLPEKTEPNKNT